MNILAHAQLPRPALFAPLLRTLPRSTIGAVVNLERLEIHPFALLAGEVVQEKRTGTLNVMSSSVRRTLYWSGGELVLAQSNAPDEQLGSYLARQGAVSAEAAHQIDSVNDLRSVGRLHELGVLDSATRAPLLRDWLRAVTEPLFSLAEGTAVFQDEPAVPPEERVFVPSTVSFLLDGIRRISNGLTIRAALGDMKRSIVLAHNPAVAVDELPLNDVESRVVEAIREPAPIESLLKSFSTESAAAARAVIGLLAFGTAKIHDPSDARPTSAADAETQRDLMLLASLASGDEQSLNIIRYARQVDSLDYYELLDLPRAATRAQIMTRADELRQRYNPAAYVPAVREYVTRIADRIEAAAAVLKDPLRRPEYDRVLATGGRQKATSQAIQQRLARKDIAEQNYRKAQDLTIMSDYYGAIVLLRQAVEFAPEHAEAWHLLGSCQERNPKWRREAAESYHRALTLDPNSTEVLISLGDLYRNQGLVSRAQACYDDVLKIEPENPEAKSRLKALREKK